MKERITGSINKPEQLEMLYQENKKTFTRDFLEVADCYDSELVRFWKIRLSQNVDKQHKLSRNSDLIVAIVLSLIIGLVIKFPDIFTSIPKNFFYVRYLAIAIFSGIILYTFWVNRMFKFPNLPLYLLAISLLSIYAYFLPSTQSDSINLVFIHIPIFMWFIFGLSFTAFDYRNTSRKVDFIRYNGELLIMVGLILSVGSILSAITVGLFAAIKVNIEESYLQTIAIFGCSGAPIISIYLIKLYPNITEKLAPIIARVFAPLVLIVLTIYFFTLIFSRSDALEDRNLLIIFNIMLLAVMAIIVFAALELSKSYRSNINILILFVLAILVIAINSVALYEISRRAITGLTPNRTIVLVSNVLVFGNLILIAINLFQVYFLKQSLSKVENTVAKYLTVYFVWIIAVIFILPFIFGLK